MHPRRSAQDVLRCDVCKTDPLQSHCKLCRINLCAGCVSKHLSDSSKRHNVVPFTIKKPTPNYPKCPKHGDKHCDLLCEKCDIPVCSTCVSDQHRGHILCDLQKTLGSKTQALQKDLEELESRIYPRYEEMASDVQIEKAGIQTNYEKITRDADQQGEILHREVTAIVNQRKADIAEMKTKHIAALDKNTDEIMHSITELKQIIINLKAILESNDISLISTYKSRNSGFRRLPSKVRVTLPSSSPQKINTEQLREMFCSLSSLSINTEDGETIKSPEAVSSPPVKPLKSPLAVSSTFRPFLDEPHFTATIGTGYNPYSVICLSEDQVWTCGELHRIMRLFNLKGKLLRAINTKSRKTPRDITVTRCGDLVYTDPEDRTVNQVKNNQIWTLITLQGWRPRNICCTTSDDLLVTMISDDFKQSKVVRYSGSTETQTIQFDDQARPIYSTGDFYVKYISENKNLDICVADWSAKEVVVVNQSGKLRFRYTGYSSNTKESFYPVGIATDSQSHILTADSDNHRIHILDQDGQFLCYIHSLRKPCGLFVDSKDNLFVAESDTAKVRKLQYMET